jgi:hypothetical protein
MKKKFYQKSLEACLEKILSACQKSSREPAEVRVMAVTKKKSAEEVNTYLEVARDFFSYPPLIGENYLQEFLEKKEELKGPYECHFIGHLQSNKAAQAAFHFSAVQSLDRASLVKAFSKLESANLPSLFLQVNISDESSKSGLAACDLTDFYENLPSAILEKLSGLMAIPKAYEDKSLLREDFCKMRELRDRLQESCGRKLELSMGMSSDYELAVEMGSNLVRIGTALLGERE